MVAVSALAALALLPGPDDEIAGTFEFNAVYREDLGTVNIEFTDRTGMATSSTLELLGMTESYQRTFPGSSFSETVYFGAPPKFGWEAHPLTLVVEHPELGKVGIKTEAHTEDQASPEIVVISRP